MSRKVFFAFFSQVVFVQCVLSQCISRTTFSAAPGLAGPYGSIIAAPFLTLAIPAIEVTPTVGGSLPLTSASAIPPDPITVESENTYEGTLAVAGELPFVGTVGFDGVLPSAGKGVVSHACGNGPARIISTNFEYGRANSAPAPSVAAFGSAAPFGYRAGYADFALPRARWAAEYPRAGSFLGNGVLQGSGIYGGVGEGNVEVIGGLPVAGDTAVIGQVPIAGAVGFQGAVPASGAVSISALCSCGCNASYL